MFLTFLRVEACEEFARSLQMGRKVSPIRMASSEYAPRTPLDVFEDFYGFGDVAS